LVVAEVDAAGLQALADSGRIDFVMEDALAFASLAQSGPLVETTALHAGGARGQGQGVAILDTGVDAAHPFFNGRVVAEACFSSNAATQGAATACPNGQMAQVGAGAARPCAASGCDHGTHVAGIAAGRAATFTGVAPNADIIAVQVFSVFSDQPAGPRPCASSGQQSPCVASFTSDQIRALDYVRQLAQQRPIAAVNMSLGGGRSAGACDADLTKPIIDQLLAAGVATVIAAGNNGFADAVSRPGCISSAITVGSTTKQDLVSGFSNRGPLLDVYAPGSDINSALPNGRFGRLSGTSMAAPHVAGAFAALRSARPSATVEAIEAALETQGLMVAGVARIRVNAALGVLPLASAPGATAMAEPQAQNQDLQAAIAAVAALPAHQPVRVILRPAPGTAPESLAAQARAAGATGVEPMAGGMVVLEATPEQINALARSGTVALMQLDGLARPQ